MGGNEYDIYFCLFGRGKELKESIYRLLEHVKWWWSVRW